MKRTDHKIYEICRFLAENPIKMQIRLKKNIIHHFSKSQILNYFVYNVRLVFWLKVKIASLAKQAAGSGDSTGLSTLHPSTFARFLYTILKLTIERQFFKKTKLLLDIKNYQNLKIQ